MLDPEVCAYVLIDHCCPTRQVLMFVSFPGLLWFVVVALSTSQCDGSSEGAPTYLSWFNSCFASFGPLLPLPIVIARFIAIPVSTMVDQGYLRPDPPEPFHLISRYICPQSALKCTTLWLPATILFYLALSTLRIVIYISFLAFAPNAISDHTFLALSLSSILSCEMVALRTSFNRKPIFFTWRLDRAIMGLTALLWILLYDEIYITGRFYHPPLATWCAFLLGVVAFQLPACWWVYWATRFPAGAAMDSSSSQSGKSFKPEASSLLSNHA